jgi:hypothetical protein
MSSFFFLFANLIIQIKETVFLKQKGKFVCVFFLTIIFMRNQVAITFFFSWNRIICIYSRRTTFFLKFIKKSNC